MLKTALSRVKYKILSSMSQKSYWALMGRFKAVPAVTSEYKTLEESLNSGATVVNMLEKFGFVHPNATTLQIGCGIGRVEYHLHQKVKQCYGIDISRTMIQKAQENVPASNATFICNNGRGLEDFKPATFELIYSIFVFQHMPRDIAKQYMFDSFDKLKPAGYLVFQIMLDENGVQPEPPASHPYGLRFYRRHPLREMLKQAGFTNISVYDFAKRMPDDGKSSGDFLFVAQKP